MQPYIKQYLSALGVVLVAMILYRGLLVPAIEPPRSASPKPIVYVNSLQTAQWWQRLFAANAWQQDQPKVLQTPRGILLFKTWTQLGPDQWRLEPLTMIIPQSQAQLTGQDELETDRQLLDQDFWIVNAERGAVIQFREALDWTKGKTPPVVGGRLEGQINITRRAKSTTEERPWHLTTSDVQIDRRRVWTVKPVEIRWDNSVIRGRDLSIFLKQDLLSDSEDDASPWGVLENMELIYIDEISIGLPPGGLWADMKRASPALPVTQGLPARLQVASGGPFRFDFLASQATLMNGVHAMHQLGALPPDQFWSQEMQVQLLPASPLAGNSPTNSVPTPISIGGLQLKKLSAAGMDPVGPINGQTLVRFDAPNIGASARAKRLVVDFADQQLELSGRLDGPQAVKTVTTLDYLDYSFRSPLIQYRQAANEKHLGWLAAEGPGEMLVAASAAIGQCNVRWQQSMHMKPDGDNQWISLVGKTLIESKMHGFMTSDVVDIWLKPNPKFASPNVSAAVAGNANSVTTAKFLPDRLRALGSVTLASSQIKAAINELNLWLVHAPDADEATAGPGLALSDSAGNPMYQFLEPPQREAAQADDSQDALERGDSQAIVKGAGMPDPTENRGPINVEGSVMQSTIIVSNKKSRIDSLTVDGPLSVFGSPTPTSPNPWKVVGQQMQLATNEAGQANVQFVGNPAKVAMGEAWLVGPVIRYDQTSGFIWMDQPGEFLIPTAALNQPGVGGTDSPPSNSSTMQWIKAPQCKWQGRLLFDGAVAHIEGDIKISGIVSPEENRFWIIESACQHMEVHLSDPINMQAPKATSASLDRVVLKDAVAIQAVQNDSQGNRLSIEQISVPSLTYHLPQSQLVGAGPGWIRSWHLGSGNLGQMASSTDVRPTPRQQIQGAHLNFRQSLVAYMERSEVVFEGKVELAAGPLQSWDEMIDLNTMQRLKVDELMLSCDLLKAYDTHGFDSRATRSQQHQGSWEFQSLGNVRFAGKSKDGDYSGHGYRLTYTQAKDLLVIEGDGRTPAHIRKEPLPTSNEQILEADVISAAINVKTMATPNLRITRIVASPQGSPSQNDLPNNANPWPTGPLSTGQSSGSQPAATNDPRNPAWLRPKQ